VTESSDAHAWLVPEIEKRTQELSAAEAAVERFRSTANLYRGGGSQPSELAQQQLSDLASELTRIRAQRSEAEARAQAARELMRRDAPDAIPDVQKSPVIQGLIAQRVRAEREYAEAATQLLPAHPRMKQLAANVNDVRRQIQREAASVVSGLEREVKALSLREELQTRTLDEAKAGLGSKATDRVRLAQLEDEVKAKRGELEGLRKRYEASRSRGTSQSVPVEVQVIATARPSSIPSRPNRLQIALLAAAATFVLGLVAVLFRELLSAGGRSVAPVAGRPAARLHRQEDPIGMKPAAARSVQGPRIAASAPGETGGGTNDARGTLGSIAAVVDRLVANAAGQTGYRTLIVGDSVDIDVRVEAIELAWALSRAGRQVVLVDWASDGVGLAPDLGVASSPGFTDLLAGDASFEDVIRPIADGGFHFVPSGTAEQTNAGDIDPDRINLLLDALDEAYEDVLITGPYAAARDYFRAIEGRVDAGVLVRSGLETEDADADSGQRLLGFDITEIDVIRLNVGRMSSSNRQAARRGPHGTVSSQALSTAT
jgi:Mrp family chromosome partitioning ATPase